MSLRAASAGGVLAGACLPWVLAAGCAWGPGEPFGEVTATLDARWEVAPGRDAGGGWQRLASDYQVRVDTATWTTKQLVLVGGEGEAPAAAPVLELATGALDSIAGGRLELGCDGAPCALPLGEIGRVELEVTGLAVAGAVRDGRTPPRRGEAAFVATMAIVPPVRLGQSLELAVDRASAPRIRLAVGVHPGAELFDAIDWAALGAGPIDLAAELEARAAITTAISEVELALDVEREE